MCYVHMYVLGGICECVWCNSMCVCLRRLEGQPCVSSSGEWFTSYKIGSHWSRVHRLGQTGQWDPQILPVPCSQHWDEKHWSAHLKFGFCTSNSSPHAYSAFNTTYTNAHTHTCIHTPHIHACVWLSQPQACICLTFLNNQFVIPHIYYSFFLFLRKNVFSMVLTEMQTPDKRIRTWKTCILFSILFPPFSGTLVLTLPNAEIH